jgi:hypothetical protein
VGRPWQHLSYAAQLDAKRRIVESKLRRIAGFEVAVEPVLASPHELGYRRRIAAHSGRRDRIYAAASHDLVAVSHCLLAEPAADAGLAAAAALARALHPRLRRVELIGKATNGGALGMAAEIEGVWDARDEGACRDWLAAWPSVRGLALRGRGWQRGWGDVQVEIEPEPGLVLHAHARRSLR